MSTITPAENSVPTPANWRNTRLQRYKTPEQRFWEKVDKNGPIPQHVPGIGNCWVWVPASPSHPYGIFKLNGGRTTPHRFSWMIHNGEIPAGLGVLHKCDNTACVRPDHLFLGDQGVNMRDAFSKGRATRANGERHAEAKLTDAEVVKIKKLIGIGVRTKDLAAMFGVVMGTIGHIKAGRNWTHIK